MKILSCQHKLSSRLFGASFQDILKSLGLFRRPLIQWPNGCGPSGACRIEFLGVKACLCKTATHVGVSFQMYKLSGVKVS